MLLAAVICVCLLGSIGMILAYLSLRESRKHIEGEAARLMMLSNSAFEHLRAHSLAEKVDADARKEQHNIGLDTLRDAYERELAELRVKLESKQRRDDLHAPKTVHSMDGREFNFEDLEPII